MTAAFAAHPALVCTVLLAFSNLFMTVAWYGNLKFPDARLWLVILVSWSIALAEYCFAVPANSSRGAC